MTSAELGTIPHISFRYAGKPSDAVLPAWKAEESTSSTVRGTLVQHSRTDPATGLKVTIAVRRFADCPAVDWVAQIENGGTTDSEIIEDILPLDLSVDVSPQERLRLHHANGSSCRMTGQWLSRLLIEIPETPGSILLRYRRL